MIMLIATLLIAGTCYSLDSVEGVWKTQIPDAYGDHFLEIGKDFISLDGKRRDDVVFTNTNDAIHV